MTDHEVFESRLRLAIDRYVADGPTDFDALEFARAVATAEPRRHGRRLALGLPRVAVPQLAWIILATALLLAALVASAVLVGSRPAPGPSSWQRVIFPESACEGCYGTGTPPPPQTDLTAVKDVVASEGGYLAVGHLPWWGSLVWTSPDGVAWDLAPAGDVFQDTELNAVVATADGYIAVGHKILVDSYVEGGVSTSSDVGHLAAAWRSADGLMWRPATSVVDSGQRGDLVELEDVAFANGRYLAIGFAEGTDFTPRMWVSEDGDHWRPVVTEPTLTEVLTGVVAGGPGFVAVGPGSGVWTSADGEVWTRAVLPDSDSMDQQLRGPPVTRIDGRVLVVGTQGTVYASDDGVTWTASTLPTTDAYGSVSTIVGLAATSRGYAAISTSTSGARLLWTSRDGTLWAPWELDVASVSSSCPDCARLLACGDALIFWTGEQHWLGEIDW